MSSVSCLSLVVPRSLFETRGWGGTQVRQGSPYSSPLRVALPNVQEHSKDRMSHPNVSKHIEDRMFRSHGPVLPPEVPRNQQVRQGSPLVTAAGRRQALRLCTPSTPPRNTSQPPYNPAGPGCPKGSPERHGGPKGFGRRGPLVHDRFVVTAAAPLRQSCVSSVSRPCGRWVSRPCGRWVSRRCAVWTLAAWRCLILHARLGLR